jgi:hypothetical protein
MCFSHWVPGVEGRMMDVRISGRDEYTLNSIKTRWALISQLNYKGTDLRGEDVTRIERHKEVEVIYKSKLRLYP